MREMIQKDFEALEWHDAVLLSVLIDRRSPGDRDEVVLAVQWADEQQQRVRFIDCYALDAQMNFGVIAPESIRAARCILDSPKLAELRQKWATVVLPSTQDDAEPGRIERRAACRRLYQSHAFMFRQILPWEHTVCGCVPPPR